MEPNNPGRNARRAWRARGATYAILASFFGVVALGLPAPAAANHNTCPTTHDLRGVVSDSVSATDTDWWRLQVGPATSLQFDQAAGVLIVLQSTDGDADLRVYKNGCSTLACSSSNGGLVADTCTVTDPGTYYVKVLYFFDSDGSAQYTLTAESPPV